MRDSTGAVIPGASVKLTNTGTNVSFSTTTNNSGFYIFPGIIPGPYKLEASSTGMSAYEATVEVQVAMEVTVDPTLKPGGTATSVTVNDISALVNVSDSMMNHVIDNSQVDQLPRADRMLLSLMVTVPGVENGGLRSSGLRYGSTDFELDGVPLVSRSRGYLQYRQPGLDSIQEVSVDSNNVSAKYNSPVAVITVTKSGTNQLHGSIFETQVNSRVGGARTRDASNALAPYSNRAQFGGSAGGPVVLPKLYNGRDKTFFFIAYEGTRKLPNALVNYSVPTQAMRNGDFNGLQNANGQFITIYDPNTTSATTFARQPFNYLGKPNNIDPSRESPLWKSVMALTPLPTLPNVNPLIASNWYGNAATIQNDWTGTGRVDHRFSEKDTVYGRYSKNYILSDTPFSGAIPLTTNEANRSAYIAPAQSVALSWVHTFSPTLFSELLVSVYRQAFYQASNPTNPGNYDSLLGCRIRWAPSSGPTSSASASMARCIARSIPMRTPRRSTRRMTTEPRSSAAISYSSDFISGAISSTICRNRSRARGLRSRSRTGRRFGIHPERSVRHEPPGLPAASSRVRTSAR